MSTHDYVIANQNGANTRSDLNNAFSAIVSNNSSASEPSTTYAYMWWADTANDLLKQRNAADSAWINILTLSTGVPVAGAADFSNGGDTAGADRTIGNNDAYAFGIETGGVERVKWDSSGNMGLGVTPASWHSVTKGFDLQAKGVGFYAVGSNAETGYNHNSYYDGDWKYGQTLAASQIRQAGGAFYFYTAPSGTADTAITWTDRLQITNDGRGLSQFTAKAWVNFNGTGTVAINDSHNVSSITDNGTGNYKVNFSNNMSNANYAVSGVVGDWDMNLTSAAPNVSYVRAYALNNNTNSFQDKNNIMLTVFGD